MEFHVKRLSFFVIQVEGNEQTGAKSYKHVQTLDADDYEESEIKKFLNGEFTRIGKRKAERHPNSEQAPTKIGRFIVEPGYDLSSNPHYNMLERLRTADSEEHFLNASDELVRAYLETSAVRGGALIAAQASLPKYVDDLFLFVMKCDFEPNIARVTDDQNVLSQVDRAISAKNMKSIQYPHMPEPGMIEPAELKIHQASHARYFEDFLKFVEYEKSLPELITHQVMGMVQEFVEEKWPEPESEERQQEVRDLELWAASEQRDIQQKWDQEQVQEASMRLIEHKPELELKFKLDDAFVRIPLAQFGDKLHIARGEGRYYVVIEGDSFRFDKEFSPVELLQPLDFVQLVQLLQEREKE